jgi:hypothetical protein
LFKPIKIATLKKAGEKSPEMYHSYPALSSNGYHLRMIAESSLYEAVEQYGSDAPHPAPGCRTFRRQLFNGQAMDNHSCGKL